MEDQLTGLFHVAVPNRRLRLMTMGYGLLLFIWLTPEDNTVWPVALVRIRVGSIERDLAGSAPIGWKCFFR